MAKTVSRRSLETSTTDLTDALDDLVSAAHRVVKADGTLQEKATIAQKQSARRRLVRGRDWHGWALLLPGPSGAPDTIGLSVHQTQPKTAPLVGRWIKVKFVEVK